MNMTSKRFRCAITVHSWHWWRQRPCGRPGIPTRGIPWALSPEVHVLANGIKDNWSQVRYAASVAARAFNDKAWHAPR